MYVCQVEPRIASVVGNMSHLMKNDCIIFLLHKENRLIEEFVDQSDHLHE